MKKLVIFSGTTEGRRLSEQLIEAGVAHTVCVASEYGRDLMRADPLLSLHTGRMNAEEMTAFLSAGGFGGEGTVVDATHPYASEVSANIRKAADALGCRYIRVLRRESELPKEKVSLYENAASCAAALNHCPGNILLTTGSKELHTFCGQISDETRARLYVRVLPTEESLSLCLEAGIDPKKIIAMHGPFSAEMNLALLRQYEIRHLVTKESGEAGGFGDKVRAASRADVFLHVISRPPEETGISVEQALCELLGSKEGKAAKKAGDRSGPEEAGICITLAGIGMGSPAGMTEEVKRALAEAEIVFGAPRLLRELPSDVCFSMYRPSDIIPVLERVRPRRALILFSGDSGFYSGARSMREALLSWRKDLVIRTLPGISSVSALAAKAGVNYDDAAIFSIHGRKDPHALHQLLQSIRCHARTFVLLSGDEDVRDLGSMLLAQRKEVRILIGSDLSSESEKILEFTPAEAASFQGQGILTALVLNETYEKRSLLPLLEDEDVLRGQTPMTKASVRHECVIRLGLREGDVVYDIGSGTGSVALEIAALDPSLTVYAFEKNEKACGLIRENIRRLHAGNVDLIEGEAPEAFADTRTPDRVFIGGSGGRLPEILAALRARRHPMRCVLTAVTLETMAEASRLIGESGVTDLEMIQLQSNPLREIGRYHLFQAQNPVLIASFTLNRSQERFL